MGPRTTIITDRSETIRDLAHKIWEEEGKPEGRADEHWHKAEKLIATKTKKVPKPKKTTSRSKSSKA